MQSRFGDECVVVVDAKHSSALQSPDYRGDRVKLAAGVWDSFLVHRESLHIELVCELFEGFPALSADLGGKEV